MEWSPIRCCVIPDRGTPPGELTPDGDNSPSSYCLNFLTQRDRGVADLDRDRLDGRLCAAQLCRCAVWHVETSARSDRKLEPSRREVVAARLAGSSWVAQRSPRRQSLRKILPPTSRHQTVGGFYYILFVARSLGSSYQRYHPNNCSYAWPRHSCNHFYSSKLADASQFTSLSLSLGAGL